MDNVNARGQKMATPAPYKPTLWDGLAVNMHDAAYTPDDQRAIANLVEALFNSQMPPARLAVLVALQHGGYLFYCPTGKLEGIDIRSWLVDANDYWPTGKADYYSVLAMVQSCPTGQLGDILVAQVYNPDQTVWTDDWRN